MEFKQGQTVELTKPAMSITLVGILGIGTRGILSQFQREQDGIRIWTIWVGNTLWPVCEDQIKVVD